MGDIVQNVLILKAKERLEKRKSLTQAQYDAIRTAKELPEKTRKKMLDRWDAIIQAEAMDRFSRLTPFHHEYLRQRFPKLVREIKTNAEKVQAFRAKRSDIGDIPAIVDQDRRDECKDDLLAFGYTYFPDIFSRSPSEIIKDYVSKMQTVFITGGRLGALLPRGYGKTSWAKIGAIWAMLYGHCDFIVLLGPTQAHAGMFLKDIVNFLSEDGSKLSEDFPEVCYPFARLEGKPQRMTGQLCKGVRTMIAMNADTLQLPTIEGSVSSGALVKARGLTSGFLGLVVGSKRPKVALVDDAQTRESAFSEQMTTSLEKTLQGGVMGLGGHDHPIGVLMTGTVIASNDLNDRYADKELHPEFVMLRHGLVRRWPEVGSESLWKEYHQLWKEDKANGDETGSLANAFYKRNRAAMDQGAEVEDAELFDRRFEQSAIQHAYNMRFVMGDDAFMSEMQNQPPKAVFTGYEIDAKTVSTRLNHLPRFMAPGGNRAIFAFTDVNHDKLRWAVVSHSHDQTAAILCYGEYPDQGDLVPRNSSEMDQKKLIYAGLSALQRRLMAIELRNKDNTPAKIRAWGIDRGYKPDTIHSFCANAVAPFTVLPCKGYGAIQYRPSERNMIGERGHLCHMADDHGTQWLAVSVDPWKEIVQRAFLCDPLSPGSCSFYGASRGEHWEFAANVCAETLSDKAVSPKGQTFWKWSLKPGSQNGYFDVLVGTYALASWFRVYRIGLARMAAPTMPVYKPRPLRDMRRARNTHNGLPDIPGVQF